MTTRYLAIYLQDHLAGSTAGLELAKRLRKENPKGELGKTLGRLVREIAEDAATLQDIMKRVGASPSTVKTSAAWVAEKVGRLKLNGQLTGYSPLSRLEEIEALRAGVHTKLGLWQTLRRLRDRLPQLEGVDVDELVARAERQLAALDDLRPAVIDAILPTRRS